MTKFAHLAHWTPVKFDFSDEVDTEIEWADLRARRFVEPFFEQTIAHWAPEEARVRTGLDALDDEPDCRALASGA